MPFIVRTRTGMAAEQLSKGLQGGLLAYMQGAKLAQQAEALKQQGEFRAAQLKQGEERINLAREAQAGLDQYREDTLERQDLTRKQQQDQFEARETREAKEFDARQAESEKRLGLERERVDLTGRQVALAEDEKEKETAQDEARGIAIRDEFVSDWYDLTTTSQQALQQDPVYQAIMNEDLRAPGGVERLQATILAANSANGARLEAGFARRTAELANEYADNPAWGSVYGSQLERIGGVIDWDNPKQAKAAADIAAALEGDYMRRESALAKLNSPEMRQKIGDSFGRFHSTYDATSAQNPFASTGVGMAGAAAATGQRDAWAQTALVASQRSVQQLIEEINSTVQAELQAGGDGEMRPVVVGQIDREAKLEALEVALEINSDTASVVTPQSLRSALTQILSQAGLNPSSIVPGQSYAPQAPSSAAPDPAVMQSLNATAQALPGIPVGGSAGSLSKRISNALESGQIEPTPGLVANRGTLPVAPVDAVRFLTRRSLAMSSKARPQTQEQFTQQFISYGWGNLVADKDQTGQWTPNAKKYQALIGWALQGGN